MVLIKPNLSGISLCTMSGIKILNYITNDLDSISRTFVWKYNLPADHNQSTMPLIAWAKI